MNKKNIFLFIALLLPTLIFLFLKFFGKNEFDIPVYYTKGVSSDTLNSECQIKISGQYFVNDSFLQMTWEEGYASIISFASEKETKEVNEIIADEKLEKIQVIALSSNEERIKNCVLFLNAPWNAVLVDNQKRIRGYYKLGDRNEMDRLEVELKILLKKY